MGLMNAKLTVDYGVKLVPYSTGKLFSGIEAGDVAHNVFGRPLEFDVLITGGRYGGQKLSELNTHVAMMTFTRLAKQRAPAALLQAVFDWGIALLTQSRIEKGSENEIIRLWIYCARHKLDPESEFLGSLPAGYTEDDLYDRIDSLWMTIDMMDCDSSIADPPQADYTQQLIGDEWDS